MCGILQLKRGIRRKIAFQRLGWQRLDLQTQSRTVGHLKESDSGSVARLLRNQIRRRQVGNTPLEESQPCTASAIAVIFLGSKGQPFGLPIFC
ncbi:hypothetical protein D3C81_702890 [compost metagenome]